VVGKHIANSSRAVWHTRHTRHTQSSNAGAAPLTHSDIHHQLQRRKPEQHNCQAAHKQTVTQLTIAAHTAAALHWFHWFYACGGIGRDSSAGAGAGSGQQGQGQPSLCAGIPFSLPYRGLPALPLAFLILILILILFPGYLSVSASVSASASISFNAGASVTREEEGGRGGRGEGARGIWKQIHEAVAGAACPLFCPRPCPSDISELYILVVAYMTPSPPSCTKAMIAVTPAAKSRYIYP